MANKFHFNPDTGKTGRCSAQMGRCPYKIPESLHGSTAQEASRNFEKIMENAGAKVSQTFKKGFSKDEVEPGLDSIMDTDLMRRMIEEDFISSRSHPDDPDFHVMCYTKGTQFTGNWNDATNSARGLMVKTSRSDFGDAVVVQRPWKKFFTLGQMQNPDGTPGWAFGDEESEDSAQSALGRINFNAPAIVTDKMDGSMLILYRDPKGNPAVSTKGSFDSEQAQYFTKMVRENSAMMEASEKMLTQHPDTTFLFEGVSKGRYQIVLKYDEDDVALLGAVKKKSGLYVPTSDYDKVWSPSKGLNKAEQMEARTLDQALSLPDRNHREGVVVLMNQGDPENQMMVKIKQDDYKRLHKIRTMFSAKIVRDTLRETPSSMQEFIDAAESGDVRQWNSVTESIEPEELKEHDDAEAIERRRRVYESAILPRAKKIKAAHDYIMSLPQEEFSNDSEAKKKFMLTASERAEANGLDRGDMVNFYHMRSRGQTPSEMKGSHTMRSVAQNARLKNLDVSSSDIF